MQSRSATDVSLLTALMAFYVVASLIHFIHNAEYLQSYPGLPMSWTRLGVYAAWALMTCVGVCGWMLVRSGRVIAGLLLIAVHAAGGLDSLGHYVVAPFSAYTFGMHATILLEVSAAALVMLECVRLLLRTTRS
jgi:hypothetical protein